MQLEPVIYMTRLPEEVAHFHEQIAPLVKKAWVVTAGKSSGNQPGQTRLFGHPDVPVDREDEFPEEASFGQSYFDGEVVIAQFNLAEIDGTLLPEGCPRRGMLWIVMDAGRYEGRAIFDPREPDEIVFKPNEEPGRPIKVNEVEMLPWACPELTPWFSWDEDACQAYDDFVQRFIPSGAAEHVQIGGYGFCNQGDFVANQQGFLLAIEGLGFGDAGGVFVWYRQGQFEVELQTC